MVRTVKGGTARTDMDIIVQWNHFTIVSYNLEH